jgi:hypothetical protein
VDRASPSRTPAAADLAEPSDPRVVVAVALIAAGVPYASSLGFGFALDDGFAVTGHPGVHGPISATDLLLRDFWGRSFMDTIGSWRPTTTLTYWIDWHLGAGRPWVFHATNVALYAALLVLAERFLARFFGSALSAKARYAAVGVFGLLAIHADVVPSIAGRAEILAAFFALLALLLPLRPVGSVRPAMALAAAAASLLAIGSKESALPVALLVPVLAHRWHSRRGTTGGAGMLTLFAANAVALAGVVAFRSLRMPWMALGPDRALENPLIGAGAGTRCLGAGAVLLHYLAHVVWPVHLAPDYSYAATDVAHEPILGALGIAVAIGAAALAARTRARTGSSPPGIADAALGFAASYIVVSHVFLPGVAVLADRLFFFPSFWLVAMAALALEPPARAAPNRMSKAVAGLFGLAMTQGAMATRDAARWRDDVTLLTSAVAAEPSVARSRRNLAQALADAGRPEDAAWQLLVSMEILSRYPAPIQANELRALDELEPDSRLNALLDHIGACALQSRLEETRAAFARWSMPAEISHVAAWLAWVHTKVPEGQAPTCGSSR